MKRFLVLLVSVLSLQASAVVIEDVVGQITEVVTGEIDPFVVGDACIVTVKKDNGDLIGLVTDFDACNDFGLEGAYIGRRLAIPASALSLIRDNDRLSVLREFDGKSFFLDVEFGAIERGLLE